MLSAIIVFFIAAIAIYVFFPILILLLGPILFIFAGIIIYAVIKTAVGLRRTGTGSRGHYADAPKSGGPYTDAPRGDGTGGAAPANSASPFEDADIREFGEAARGETVELPSTALRKDDGEDEDE